MQSVHAQSKIRDVRLKIFLVDDGSTDGTTISVASAYPEVNILRGDGKLYWNGGMNMAWRAAVKEEFDYYIWLNDDVSLFPDAFATLFESYRTGHSECGTEPVIVGCFSEADSHTHAYGGFSVSKSIWGITKRRILPGDTIKKCDTFNGNLVLIPQSVVQVVGLLDDHYTHAFGDIDYGHRCKAKNIPMYITAGYVGECPRNAVDGSWFDPNATLRERYRRLMLPTGLPPAEYFYSYRKDCSSVAGVIALLKLYLRLLFPGFWSRLPRTDTVK